MLNAPCNTCNWHGFSHVFDILCIGHSIVHWLTASLTKISNIDWISSMYQWRALETTGMSIIIADIIHYKIASPIAAISSEAGVGWALFVALLGMGLWKCRYGSIAVNVPKYYPLSICKLLQYQHIRHANNRLQTTSIKFYIHLTLLH